MLYNASEKNNSTKGRRTGIGFCGALTILFIALKLFNKITWSWLWVLSPLWLPPVFIFCISIIFIVVVNGINRKSNF